MELTAKLEMKAIRGFSFVNLKTKAAFSRVPKSCCIENNQNLINSNIQERSHDKNFRPTSYCISQYNSKNIHSNVKEFVLPLV